MKYGEILTNAWKTIWKHKILWLFGILAGCASGSGGGGGGGGSNSKMPASPGGMQNIPFLDGKLNIDGDNIFRQVTQVFQSIPIWVYVLIVFLFLILFLLKIFLGTVGRIGLIKGTLMGNSAESPISFGPLLKESLHSFWRFFLLDLLTIAVTLIIIIGILVVVFLPIFLLVTTNAESNTGRYFIMIIVLCLVPIMCLIIPASFLVDILIKQIQISIVEGKAGFIVSIKKGWKIFIKNLGRLVLLALILLFGGGIIGVVIMLPFILVFMPLILSLVLGGTDAAGAGIIVSVILVLLYLPIAIFLSGVLQAYIYSAWTHAYTQIESIPTEPPILATPPATVSA